MLLVPCLASARPVHITTSRGRKYYKTTSKVIRARVLVDERVGERARGGWHGIRSKTRNSTGYPQQSVPMCLGCQGLRLGESISIAISPEGRSARDLRGTRARLPYPCMSRPYPRYALDGLSLVHGSIGSLDRDVQSSPAAQVSIASWAFS
jgi:hypothetical protein